jgi:predicted MFS family arabinose efflux permease
MVAMPFSGRLLHRFAYRPLVAATVGIWCLALILPGIAGSLLVLCLVLVPFGAAAGLADNAMNAHAVRVESLYGHSIMSSIHGFWSVGLLAGSGIAALCAHAGISTTVQFSVAGVGLAIFSGLGSRRLLGSPLVVPESSQASGLQPGSGHCGGSAVPASPDVDAPPLFALPSRKVLLIGVVGLCAVFGEQAGTDWSALFLRDQVHGSVALSAVAVTAFSASMAVVRLGGDTVVRRIGATLTVRLAGVCATLGALGVTFATSLVISLIGFALLGGGVAVVVPLVFAAAGRVGPHPGRSIAGVAGVSYGAGLAAPGVIGGVASVSSLRVSFGLVAVGLALMVLGAGVLTPSADRPRP